jgi:protein-S-isoprenylcysteine O-methyltransferase Ste14
MADQINHESPAAGDGKATGDLRPATGMLTARDAVGPVEHPRFIHNLALRAIETAIFLVAVLGAVALGLGITDYFVEHRYVLAYLAAYAGFRFADLIVREDTRDQPADQELSRRMMAQLPVLIVFAAAPFERTYVYGGLSPAVASALGFLIELLGMWLALGARIQIGYFTSGGTAERPVLVKSGFYRYIRHPIYAGTFFVTFGWTLIYGAPVTAILTVIIGGIFAHRRIKSEEAALSARFGEEYESYMRQTDALIPAIW